MNLTSEQVHWIYGGLIAAAALLLMVQDYQRFEGRWLDYILPALLLLFGIELLIDPLVHAAALPKNYGAETVQHFALGLILIVSAAGEMVRVRRTATGWIWRLPFAAVLLIAAGFFAFHAQHDSNVPMLLLMGQHRVIAATLALASLAFVIAPPRREIRQPSAFSFLVLLLGLELMLYTEGSFLVGAPMTTHAMQSR